MEYNSGERSNSDKNMNRPDLSMQSISNILSYHQYMAPRLGYYPYIHPYPVYGGPSYPERNSHFVENTQIKPSRNTKLNPSKAKCIWKAK